MFLAVGLQNTIIRVSLLSNTFRNIRKIFQHNRLEAHTATEECLLIALCLQFKWLRSAAIISDQTPHLASRLDVQRSSL